MAALGAAAVLSAPAHAQLGGDKAVERVSGKDRYETADKASKSLWPDWNNPQGKLAADAVVLAKGDAFPDALAGIPLASAKQGPLLVTPGAGLDPTVLDEIRRVLPQGRTVYVLGGVKALSPTVDAELTKAGYGVRRIAGADRFDTSVQIAHELGNPQRVVIATGTTFPDALAAGPLASMGGVGRPGAILLSNDVTLPSAVAAYIRPIIGGYPSFGTFTDTGRPARFDPDHFVLAVGGHAVTAVGRVAVTLPQQYSNFDTHNNFGNASGPDRYATACAAATWWMENGTSPTAIGVATASNYPDALGGGAAIAQVPGPLLLAAPTALPACAATFVRRAAPQLNWVEIYGGTAAIPVGVENQLHQLTGF